MNANKRKRIIEKLRKLADPARNPNQEEVKAANRKLERLLQEEAKATEGALMLRMKTEPIKVQTLFNLGRKPKPWEGSLFSFICRTNQVEGFYTVTGNGTQHFLRAAGRPLQLRKAELQYLWAISRIQDASRKLKPEIPQSYKDSYEHGAAVELVATMKAVCGEGDNSEAKNWLKAHTELKTTEKITVIPVDPYWSEGKKALKKAFYSDG